MTATYTSWCPSCKGILFRFHEPELFCSTADERGLTQMKKKGEYFQVALK
jgi:uncharacterized Zn finger protein (UPF0148 family)